MKILKRTTIFLLLLEFASHAIAQEHWKQIAQPTTKDLLKVFFLDELKGWAVGREGTIIKTVDGANTWTPQDSRLSADITNIFMVNERIGWALSWVNYTDTATFYGTTILNTTNGGLTWVSKDFPALGKYLYAIAFLDSLNGWVGGTEGALYQTTNSGTSWDRANIDSSAYTGFPIRRLRFFSRNYGFGMGGHYDIAGVVWRTTNAGQNWAAAGVSSEPVYDMHFVDSLNVIGMSGDFEYGASMIRTKNAGVTWDYTPLNIVWQPRAMAFRTASEGWMYLSNFFMVTLDTASTWAGAESSGSRQIFDFVFPDSTVGFAVADSGVILRYSRIVTDADEATSIPSATQLLQNYPNPFNPQTTIRFTVGTEPDRATSSGMHNLSLRVYDVLGREIATLVHTEKSAGEYSVVWDASNVASGIYFYKLSYDSFVRIKKMVVAK